ncbi:MAG: hypothetical protein NVSMB37_8000 [Candidatus Saccharimonadales bacterium]
MSKQLHNGQLAILELLYKYRFGSRQLLARSLGVKADSNLHEKLIVLSKHGYIGRVYDTSFRFLGKPIIYYLKMAGLRVLQTLPNHEFITDKDMRASYRPASLEFMFDTIAIYELTLALQQAYPGLRAFTKRDMQRYSYFPQDRPDVMLSLPSDRNEPRRFYLDYIPTRRPNFTVVKKIVLYAEFFEDGGWAPISSSPAVILLVAEQPYQEKTLQQLIRRKFDCLGIDNCNVYTSNCQSLLTDAAAAVWTNTAQTEFPVRLVEGVV